MRLRLRLSLIARMGVALGVLGAISFVVGLALTVLGGVLGLATIGWIHGGVEVLAGLPRASAVTTLPPLFVAALAALGPVAAVYGWPHVRAHTDEEYLMPPTTPVSASVTAGVLGCCYLVVVEGSAAVLAALSTVGGFVLVVALGVALAFGTTVAEVRRRIRALRGAILEDTEPAGDRHPEVDATVRRLAHLAGVPAPGVRVADSERPESVTVGADEDAVVVVSAGLLEALSDREIEAVLAHEVGHLANGDSRVMGAALATVLAADEWIGDDPDGPGDYAWNGLFGLLKVCGQFGVAVLARGREWSADAAAAELTGEPAALASALGRLNDGRARPATDLREWEGSVAVLNVLPPADPAVVAGPFRTHPPTDERVERLRARVESAESSE